jgi:hypothetical protein
MKTTLPTDSNERKRYGLAEFLDDYFPAALAGIALHSYEAGAKHTGGKPMHKRWLSNDHRSCQRRHLMDMADFEAALDRMAPGAPSQCREQLVRLLLSEANANAWRACALSQILHEKYGGAPLAPAAVLEPPPEALPVVIGKELDKIVARLRGGLKPEDVLRSPDDRRWHIIGTRRTSRKAKRAMPKAPRSRKKAISKR